MDIALDEEGSTIMGFPTGRLYVSGYPSNLVRYYNTSTWEMEGSVPFERAVIGIGLDKTRGLLYAGFFAGASGQNYLMRYDLDGDPSGPNTYLEKDMGAPVMDIAADEDTGYIYLTLKRPTTGNRLGVVEVYDPTNWVSTDPCSLVLLDQETDDDFSVDGPAGIAVGSQYKPPRMYIDKTDDIDQGLCVLPDDYITYTICYHPGENDEHNVVVTDYLPWGVDFISADPCSNGYYTDRPAHTYTWDIGFVPGHDPCDPSDPNQYLQLTVQANEWANPSGELENIVEIESDDSYNKAEEYTPVCCWHNGIIHVNAHANGAETGIDWTNAYTDLQDAMERTADGCGCEIWVARGVYSPGKDSTDSFEIPDNVEVYGG